MSLSSLEHFNDEYGSIDPPEKKSFEPIPDGKYQARIDKIYMDVVRSSGSDQLCWEFVILVGKFEKRRLFKKSILETRENLSYLKLDLETLKIHIDPISTIDENLDLFKDKFVEVYVKNREYNDKNYYNVYINNLIVLENPGSSQSFKDEIKNIQGDDAIPF
jgi:hypothetical protein